MLTDTQKNALGLACLLALHAEEETGCPAVLTVSQWALESGWGRYQPGNNCFGIKEYQGCSGVQELATHEYVKGRYTPETLRFAEFHSLLDCFIKHGKLIAGSGRYQDAFARFKSDGNLQELAFNIAPIYAPGNVAYGGQLASIMHMPDVIYALQAARAQSNRALKDRPTPVSV